MLYSLPHKTKQFFFVLIKLSIVAGAFYFIYYKVIENERLSFTEFASFLKENHTFSTINIMLLILLSGLNWCLEILKWQHLVKIIKNISFKNALEQSLGGLTASLITPNRIGDYGAKAVYFIKPHRKKIVLLNLLGNMVQMTVTTILGIIGVMVFINKYKIDLNFDKLAKLSFLILFVVILVIILLKQNQFKIKGFSTKTIFTFIKNIPKRTHVFNLTLSLLRYVVFSFQFYYLLTIFGVKTDYLSAMTAITSMYFLASIVPSISIFDIVIKGSVAVFLFGFLQVNELTVLSIITIMWLLNFAVPSLFGSYFVLNFKLPKPSE